MATLFNTLHTASTALDVYSRALGNEEANVSNASTEGFAALRSRISAIGLNGPSNGTNDYITLTPSSDIHADALVRAASSQAESSQTLADQLTPVLAGFDITGGTGILAAFQKFTSAFARLSVNPDDPSLKNAAVNVASGVAAEFRKVASQLDTQRAVADSDVAVAVTRINQLSSQIRQYNVQLRGGVTADSGVDANLRNALDELSSLIDIGVSTNTDGTLSILAGGQQPLVLGDQSYTLSADPNQPPLSQIVSSGGGGSPASYGGRLGALLDFRNNTLTEIGGGNGVVGTLNQLAKGFAARVNSLLTAGQTAAGTPGAALYTWDHLDDSNAAGTLSVDPAFTPAQLATGTVSASNGTADLLAKLVASGNAADQIGGQSAQDFFSGIAASVGRQLSDARDLTASGKTALTSAQALRQAKSGVSLDEEAVSITAYQRAYQANAKVISIVNELAGDIVNLIR